MTAIDGNQRQIKGLPPFGMILGGLFLWLMLLFLLCPPVAAADLYSTRPSTTKVKKATAKCTRGSFVPPKGIIGISDPHTLDPGVTNLIHETGVKWVRAEFHWSKIQPTPGAKYNWRPYDRMVKRFNDKGIKILAVLTYIPEPFQKDWTVIDREFRRFVNAATKRYAARGVHTWEVFNEPNLTGYGWLMRKHDSRDFVPAYTLLLARVNAIVRKNDPKGVVVLGGLAGDNERTLSPEETMRTIYRLGARKCFDVFAYHPYGYQNRFSEARARIEAILAAGKDGGKRVWFNEYGWTDFASMDMTLYPTAETNPLMAAFKQRKQAHALFWFAAKDYSTKQSTPTFGLADFDLKKRPSFKTFKYLVKQSK